MAQISIAEIYSGEKYDVMSGGERQRTKRKIANAE